MLFYLSLLLLLLLQPLSGMGGEGNILRSGGFEGSFSATGIPGGWGAESYGDNKVTFRRETENPGAGKAALNIVVSEFNGGAVQLAAARKKGEYGKGKCYEFSALLRGDMKVPLTMQLRQGPKPYKSYAAKSFSPTKEWKRYSFRQVLADGEDAGFRFILNGTGSVWIDDVCIREVKETVPAPNLIANGSFELGFDAKQIPAGWIEDSAWAPLSVKYEPMTVNPRSGKHALKIQSSDFRGGAVQLATPVKLEKGKLYEISACLQGDLTTPVSLMLRRRSAPYTTYASKAFTVGNEWIRYSFRQAIPDDIDPLFMLRFAGDGRLNVDDVSVREISASDTVYENAGKNIFHNSSFELGTEGWALRAAGWGDALHQEEHNLDIQGVIDPNSAAHGKSSLRFDAVNQVSFSLNLTSKYYRLNAGRPHTLSFYAKCADGNSMTVAVGSGEFFTGSMMLHAQQKFKLTDGFQRFELRIPKLPMATDDAYFVSINTSCRTSIWFDAFQLEEREQASTYQDHGDLEAKLSLTQPFGLIKQGERAAFRLALRNTTDRVLTAKGSVTGLDVFGREQPLRSVERTLQPHETVTEAFEFAGPGFWTVGATGNFPPSEVMAHFIPPQPEASPETSAFGAHFQLNQSSMDFAKLIGFKLNRLHPPVVTRWSVAESKKGKWKFFDKSLNLARKNGIGVLGLLYATPLWASSAPEHLRNNGGHNGYCAYPPKELKDWENYVRTIVTRYRDQIRFWEVWNEPDGGFFHTVGENSDLRKRADAYAQLAVSAARIIKEIDPGITLVIGSGCHMPPKHWLDPVLNHPEAYAASDVLSIHSYGHVSHFPQYAEELRRINRERGGDKPFWHSEYGIAAPSTGYRYLFEMGGDRRETLNDVKSVLQGLVYNLAGGYQKLFYYHLDSSRRSNRRECSAFREWDGMARFTAGATAVLISLLENKQFAGYVPTTDGVAAFGFSGRDRDVVVFWQTGSGEPLTAEFAGKVATEALEMDGTSLEFSAKDGRSRIACRDWPRYLIFAPGTLKNSAKR